jgi:4-carboxymuconolactone decarboxylase
LLNVGGTVQDLVELLVLSTAIVGFPVAIDGIAIVRAILKDRNITYSPLPCAESSGDDRRRKGKAALASLLSQDEAQYTEGFSSLAPDLARWAIDFAFGDVLSREGFDQVAKFLAITSMLATVGNRADELRDFIRGVAHAGVGRDQLIEAAIQLSAYAGFPAALNFFGAIEEGWSMPPTDADVSPEQAAQLPTENTLTRRNRGLATLRATSATSGDAIVHSFDDLAPEIGAMIIEHSYGDIFSRSGLDPKTRELTACAALAGSLTSASETPLRVHISAALAVGATQQEIIETLLNVAPYRGFPAVRRAMEVACRLFAETNKSA